MVNIGTARDGPAGGTTMTREGNPLVGRRRSRDRVAAHCAGAACQALHRTAGLLGRDALLVGIQLRRSHPLATAIILPATATLPAATATLPAALMGRPATAAVNVLPVTGRGDQRRIRCRSFMP